MPLPLHLWTLTLKDFLNYTYRRKHGSSQAQARLKSRQGGREEGRRGLQQYAAWDRWGSYPVSTLTAMFCRPLVHNRASYTPFCFNPRLLSGLLVLFVFCAASREELLDDSDADGHYQSNLAELTDSDAISEDSWDSYSSGEQQFDEEQELVCIMEQNEDLNVRQRQQQLAV